MVVGIVVVDAVQKGLKLKPRRTLVGFFGILRNVWQCLVVEERERIKSVLDVLAAIALCIFFFGP